jgi:hypothetical protein
MHSGETPASVIVERSYNEETEIFVPLNFSMIKSKIRSD